MPEHRMHTPKNCLDSIIWYLLFTKKKNSQTILEISYEPERAGLGPSYTPALKHTAKNLVTTKYLCNPCYLI